MFRVERLVQIMFVLLASMSGLLLGLGQRDQRLTGIAVLTSVLAFVLNDYFKLIRFNKWIANLAAIIVTAYTLSGFFTTGTGGKLILIANLLVYLQAVLLFQKKTPRVCWQIMVLSLLQVVVAAAFNLEFEGGFFFFIYMMLAGITMMLLTLYSDSYRIEYRNKVQETKLKNIDVSLTSGHQAPVAVFDQENRNRKVLRRMGRHIGWLAVIGVTFTGILFFVMPKSQTAWFGPKILPMSEVGITNKIDLDQEGLIALSADSVFRVWFTDPATEEPVFPEGEVYFRGMAMGTVRIKDGHTTWEPPYTRVYDQDTRLIRDAPRNRSNRLLNQRIVLEPTQDPMLFSAAPWYKSQKFKGQVAFCRPLSALRRVNEAMTQNGVFVNVVDEKHIEYSPYPYQVDILVERTATGVRTFNSWPYIPEENSRNLAENPLEKEWLTVIDKSRYPTLVSIADQVKKDTNSESHLRIARRLEQHFLQNPAYRYTLDYRTVNRNRSIDAVEDFVANHKQGHCEYYASALVLMLRSQGIPARVVVGFRGGTKNEALNNYVVQKQHAHAWVEVYIRPEDCGPELLQNEINGVQSGSWLILDPTPASSGEIVENWGSGGNALTLARDLWRDYVLGLNNSENDAMMESLGGDPLAYLSSMMDEDWWKRQFDESPVNDPNSVWWYLRIIIPVALIIIIVFVLGVRGLRVAKKREAGEKVGTNFIWQIIGSALSLVSPRLGRYVLGDVEGSDYVEFYQRFQRILRNHGLVRRESQTQLEFAQWASQQFSDHAESKKIKELFDSITKWFYGVRFGRKPLNREQQSQIDGKLRELENAMNQTRQNSELKMQEK